MATGDTKTPERPPYYTTIRLSAENRHLLDELKRVMGLSGAAVFTRALAALAAREGVDPLPADAPAPNLARDRDVDDPRGPIPTSRPPASPWER